jgi:DNA-binding NtrC family response regulator
VPPLRQRQSEIPALAEFFLAKYARLYRRTPVRPTTLFLERLVSYLWPGNIRELENTIKRFVVLQDESFILAEMARMEAAGTTRTAAGSRDAEPAAHAQAPSQTAASQPIAAAPAASPAPPPVLPAPDDATGLDLQALAKAAAMRAERDAIEAALSRFRWNRRKAAVYLKVSYKTLLNKMRESGIKETGIGDPA